MQTATSNRDIPSELASMLTTLCSYDHIFGPHAPQTLHLTKDAGIACWRCGERGYARVLLTRAIRDLGQYLGRTHEARLEAATALQQLLIEAGDRDNAMALQEELVACATEQFGATHPETLAIREKFIALLLTQPAIHRQGIA